MLEGLVASLLNRFLGMYIRNFDPGQLKVGIWSGDVKLRDLELRREALDQLKLPINVVEGHLGQLTLRIPWSNLRGQPVQVYIEDVFLLAAPKEDAEWDEEEEERRRQALKIEKLDSAEMLKDRSQEGMSQEEQQKNQSFTDSLVTKIVDNLQITVKNIHLRYEDSISAPGHPFAIGLTLEEFSAISTDGEWKPTYIQNSAGPTHKLATLGALAIYWNTDTDLLGTGRQAEVPGASVVSSHDEMLDNFKDMIVKGEDPEQANHQFILKPVNGQAKIEIDKSGKVDRPHMKAGLVFDEIGVVLDDQQYRDALMLVDLFHYFIRHQEYKKLQPKGVTPMEDPRAWFKFAGNAVLSKIHDRNRRWSWAFFKERRDDRIRYIELFKKKKKQTEQLTPEEIEELNKLEWKLNYEDMRFWRSLARNQLKKENVGVKKAETAKQKQGWIAWAWGSKPQEEEDPETTMTEEQRQELYDAIDWDEKTALAECIDLPKETVKLQIDASLNTGSFTLKRDPHEKVVEVVSLYFDAFQAKFLQRPDSFLADMSLGGLRVNDGTTPNSLFTQIVRVKDAPDEPGQIQRDDENEDVENAIEPFFQFQFEKNPLDGASDMAVTGKLKPLEIIWNPNFLVAIMQFFKPPERHMESIGALMESAGATVEELRQQTRVGLEFALEEHKTINAKLDLQAPLIIVPESITSKSTICLILDAGHISVNSELVDQDTMKDIQSKQKQAYTDEDYKRLESLMYDKFLVKLSSTQLLIGPSIEETKAQLTKRDESQSMHVVDKINMDFILETSIIPKAPNLAKVRISGKLPVLHASVSDKKYKSLMRLIDVALPNLNEEEAPAQSSASGAALATSRSRAQSVQKKSDKNRDRPSSTAFQFSTSTQEAIILQESDNDDDDAEFQDAPEVKADESLKLQQRNFELKFEVERLQGSLYRSDPEGRKPDQLLVELVAENFGLNLCVRPYDMIIETSLESVVIDDYVENPPAEFKSIVSSGGKDSDKKDLIHVKIIRVKKESLEFMPKYQGVELNIDVAVSTINLVVTRKTLLTLLDFILVTFTNDEAASLPTAESPSEELMDAENMESSSELQPPKSPDSGSIRIKVDLTSIVLILNNDGIRLATLSLNHADVGIFLMGKTMRIAAKLGDLSLLDDINQGASSDSNLRKLIEIQGDDLADFRYETFDAQSVDTYPGYDSSIFLRAGSIKLNFLEEPFRKIIDFLVKFGKMQAIFNAARQAAANQASQIQNAGRVKFDINISTPIVVFPGVMLPGRPKRDLVTAYLGEIYAENKFVPLDDSKDSQIAMQLSAGIRNIRMTSYFHYPEDESEELELIDKVDLGFKVTYAEHTPGAKRPDMEIEGSMTDFNLRITQIQLKFLLQLAKSVPAAFAVNQDEDEQQAIEDVPKETRREAKRLAPAESKEPPEDGTLVDLGPELGVDSSIWTKLDLAFHVHTIGLELVLADEDEPVGDIEASSLSKFSLDDTKVKLRMMTDGSLESELLIQSFTIQDSRKRETNKFRKIMTSSNKDVQQFMASVSISGGKERNLIAMVAVDSPRVIFALDYIFAIQSFIAGGFAVDEPVIVEDDESMLESGDGSETDSTRTTRLSRQESGQSKSVTTTRSQGSSQPEESSMTIAFRVNVVEAQIILIANPLSSSSEAIVLGTKQILMSKQHALTLQVSQMGMFLCRMDRFEDSRLRIIDDFSLQMSTDSSKPNMTSVYIDVEPLVLRLSLRDILLALQIFSKASELSGHEDEHHVSASDEKAAQLARRGTSDLKRRTASGKGITTTKKSKAQTATSGRANGSLSGKETVQHHEELTATLEGMRVILIGDLHELPILDLSVKGFTARATDWTSSMRADTNIDMFVNVYNFSKSAWEPLIEPWQMGLQISKEPNPDRLSIDFTSQKMLEVTVTSATIALASKSAQFLTQKDDVLSKPRGADAPYRIRNYTGFDINVWADIPDEENEMSARLEDGEEAPWRFEDWEKMRENLSPENNSGIVGVRLEGSGFDSINRIPINREGEALYSLRPRKDQVLHRLLVEVTLGADNVKYITFRSPLLVENKTQIPVELGVFDAQEGHLLKIEKIAPGESRPAPVGAAFLKSLLVRPDQGFGYGWCTEPLWWRDLLHRPTKTITCTGENDRQTPPFYFQMHANYDKTNPLTR